MARRSKTQPTGLPPGGRRTQKSRVVTEDEVPHLAKNKQLEFIRQVYTQARRRWEAFRYQEPSGYTAPKVFGGTSALRDEDNNIVERGYPNQWKLLLNWCEEQDIDPITYINFQFESLSTQESHPPEPHELRGGRYVTRWERDFPHQAQKISVKLMTDARAVRLNFKTARAEGDDYETACISACNPYESSPLFRYCFLKSECRPEFKKIRKLMKKLLAPAVLQYMTYSVAYANSWSTVLPKDFVQKADKWHRAILAGADISDED